MRILNLLVAVTGTAMSVVVLVVLLIYSLHFDLKPSLREDVPLLIGTAVGLGLMGASGVLAAVAHWRGWRAPWRFDAGMVATCVVVVTALIQGLSA